MLVAPIPPVVDTLGQPTGIVGFDETKTSILFHSRYLIWGHSASHTVCPTRHVDTMFSRTSVPNIDEFASGLSEPAIFRHR